MRLIARALVVFTGNIAALLIAAHLLPGFALDLAPENVLMAALILGLLNLTLKPFLKLLLTPLIILTLGLALIVVNALVLMVLDILTSNLTILGILPLLLAALLIGFINAIFHLATKQ